jgi:hypothetical protein
MESSRPGKEKKHKKKQKKEKHKKSSKSKKEKRKKKHRSSSESSKGHHTPLTQPLAKAIIPPTINLDDEDPSIEEIETSKEIFTKLVGKRESQENGGESKSKKQKLISTDPDVLVSIIKKTIETSHTQIQSTVVSSASESDG